MSLTHQQGGASALSSREGAVLAFLRAEITDTSCPSFSEIQAATGLSSRSLVHRAIQGLRKKGWIEMAPGERRSLRLTDPLSGKSIGELLALRDRIDWVLAGRVQ